MRTGFLVATLCLIGFSLSGCGDDTSATDLGTTSDLSHDLSASSGTSCLAIITCAQSCGASSPSCVQACVTAGSAASKAKYTALFGCGLAQCLTSSAADGGSADGGAPACSSQTDTSAACLTCTATKAQGMNCTSQLQACAGS